MTIPIIQRVFMNRKANQKLVTIPKDCNINEGDFVEIIKRELNVYFWVFQKNKTLLQNQELRKNLTHNTTY